MNCGSRILGTVHAGNVKELEEKEIVSNWLKERIFGRYVVLKKLENGNRRFEIYDEKLEQIC